MSPRNLVLIASSLGLAAAASPAAANDTSVEAVGGTVSLRDGAPGISLQAEYVRARLFPESDSLYVECLFYLHNSGETRDLTVGFPEETMGVVGESPVPFLFFRSYRNGVELQATRHPGKGGGDAGSRGWWTKQVTFPTGDTTVIRDVYAARPGTRAPDLRLFSYTLWTGKTWDGPIGSADIVVSVAGASPGLALAARPGGYAFSDGEYRWHFRDFEPADSLGSVEVTWAER
jgi:hypothetical protein